MHRTNSQQDFELGLGRKKTHLKPICALLYKRHFSSVWLHFTNTFIAKMVCNYFKWDRFEKEAMLLKFFFVCFSVPFPTKPRFSCCVIRRRATMFSVFTIVISKTVFRSLFWIARCRFRRIESAIEILWDKM